MRRPCSETSPANEVNNASDGMISQNIRNCMMAELPPEPGVMPNVSGYGRMHTVSVRPTTSSISHAANRPGRAITERMDERMNRDSRNTRTTHTNAIAHAKAIP